jgi:RHS repeat-associated protein
VDNDLTGMTHAFTPGAGPGSNSFTYGRDASGKVSSIGINQPAFEWMPTLGYARTYGPASNMNRISSVSDSTESRALTWNGDGDLSQEVRTPVGGSAVTWTYHWTYGHRLAVVTNNAAVSPLTASYHYDSDDRRTKKVVNGVTTRTMWSGTDELAEYDVSGDLIRRFIPDGTGGMDQRLATVTSNGTVYWHHTDHQGSVIATSTADGQVHATATYSPHGEGAPPAQSPFGYTGRQYDPETGLYYYRARYYSPYLGTFLTTDPIGTKDDPNLYMYVGLDPANATDPGGKQTCYTNPCPMALTTPGTAWAKLAGYLGQVLDFTPEHRTEYYLLNVNVVGGAGAQFEGGGYVYYINNRVQEFGLVVGAYGAFGWDMSAAGGRSVKWGPPEDGLMFNYAIAGSVGAFSGGISGSMGEAPDTFSMSGEAPLPVPETPVSGVIQIGVQQHIPISTREEMMRFKLYIEEVQRIERIREEADRARCGGTTDAC